MAKTCGAVQRGTDRLSYPSIFSRLFNSRVTSSYTYNGLGVGQNFPESFIAEIETTLGLGATPWAAVDAKQKNYYAEHGISVATTDWWLHQRGERIPVFNEEGFGVPNHSMYKLTDALALYDVLGTLDGGLSLTSATAILNAASANASASLESVLDSLRRLYGDSDPTPTARAKSRSRASASATPTSTPIYIEGWA